MSRARREADLVRYYNQEASARAVRALPPRREAKRAEFVDRLVRERRRTLLEVGSGPGADGRRFTAAGFGYTGVDLTPTSVATARRNGLTACVASVLELPFRDGHFDAGWTMSTLMHVGQDDFEQALDEIIRVLRAGSPLAIGVWGASCTHEACWDDGTDFGPARFFSYRTDGELVRTLERFGTVEEFEAWPSERPVHYQWAVLRTT